MEICFCSKILLFRQVQMVHKIHGERGVNPNPVGGRLISLLELSILTLRLVTLEESTGDLKGAASQRFLAKGQWKNKCREVSGTWQWGQRASKLIPGDCKRSPTVEVLNFPEWTHSPLRHHSGLITGFRSKLSILAFCNWTNKVVNVKVLAFLWCWSHGRNRF